MDEIVLKKGLDINLQGVAETHFRDIEPAKLYALKPSDFIGLTPKLVVKVGDTVKIGSPIFYDKYVPENRCVSPVSGIVKDVRRGERRKLLEVIIEADGEDVHETFDAVDLASISREELIKELQLSGLWTLMLERPYGVIPDPKGEPKAIYVSCFDTAPLAPDFDLILLGKEKSFVKGVEVLQKLTKGYVHLGLDGSRSFRVGEEIKGVERTRYTGPHPAGNVGTQIAQKDPINKGELVWTVRVPEVIAIGERFLKNIYDSTRVLAITGSEVLKPAYVKTRQGAKLSNLVKDNICTTEHLRFIGGNVLTGTHLSEDGYVGTFDMQITVIPEGDDYDFLGWITPNLSKKSVHRTSLSYFFKKKEYRLNANLNGGERAIIFSGEYDKVLPMDILAEFLFKAIIVKDIDKMEQLGIYEILPEDVALCEFVCTSKMSLQQLVRDGLDLMRKEMG